MANYVFIESRDGFESRDTQFVVETATTLKQRGHQVTIFLVQNAVLGARRNIPKSNLSLIVESGISLLADDFSLCERGIQAEELLPGIQATSIEAVVTALVQENTKAIWH